MRLQVFLSGLAQFHCHEFEASLLEALDDLADQSALDAVGLDRDERSLGRHALQTNSKQ